MLLTFYIFAGIALIITCFIVGRQARKYSFMSKMIMPMFFLLLLCVCSLFVIAGFFLF